ncbi:hemolysin III family protein [bacterium]|nr:MAG: hemolysin III family protein [bacterium]
MSTDRQRLGGYSLGEEIAHSLTHGIGLLLGIVALVLLVVVAARSGSAMRTVAASIYGATLVLLYAASTFYHALPQGRAKQVFNILDHSGIFLLIAGTYTPITLVTLRGPWGWSLFGTIWGCAILGIVIESVWMGRVRRPQLVLYLLMGWAALVAIRPLVGNLERGGLMLLFAGGLAYSGGVVFYAWRGFRYHHAIWHLFVLAGSALHVFAVLLYVL